ncbi:MAG TPA: hypothetical protein V6D22_08805 [Candidatus Obscuribacterales bacterium]
MTDDATTAANVDRLAAVSTKLERESRMTRYLLVICTAANIAVCTFGVKVSYDMLPPIMLAYFMEHMQEVQMLWKGYEFAASKHPGGAKAPIAPPPAENK